MDVRNTLEKTPVEEHGGTCVSAFLVHKESMRELTMGGYLEFVNEFELVGDAKLEPHYHNTDEFYYILRGRAVMWIEGERRVVAPGDLIHIPRNAVHSIWSEDPGEPFRALGFAVSYMPPDEVTAIAVPERIGELG